MIYMCIDSIKKIIFSSYRDRQHYYYCILVTLMVQAHSKHTTGIVLIVRSAQSQLMNPTGQKGDKEKNYRPFDGSR